MGGVDQSGREQIEEFSRTWDQFSQQNLSELKSSHRNWKRIFEEITRYVERQDRNHSR